MIPNHICGCTSTAVQCSTKVEKKHKHSLACQSHGTSFMPLCVSVDGLLAPEVFFCLFIG